jgi:alpha-beta hydrolase superfamily lysophospholipase
MMRLTSAAAVLFVVVAAPILAQQPVELSLSHVAGEREIAVSRLSFSASEVRVKGQTKPPEGGSGADFVGILQRFPTGWLKRYDRELKSARDGTMLSSVSVVADEDALLYRETGPMGSRTRSLTGPAIDVVVDTACPEMLIPFLLDGSRKTMRVLMLPDLEVKTIVLEERDRARYAAIPGGGVTLATDPSGGFQKLTLPGAQARSIIRAGAETRPAATRGRETAVILNLEGGVRLGLTLTLPATGQGPFPGLLLLGDAGARDRDGTGGGSQVPVLRLLADELAGQGIATVRADRRGVGTSAGPDPSLAALVEDARNLLEVLTMHPAIDPDRVMVAGHGEGAVLAVELARGGNAKIAGLVLLAGPARPLAEALEARLRVRLLAAGQSQQSIEGAVAALRTEIAALREMPEGSALGPGQPLLRDLARIDPAAQIPGVRVPMLVIHGSEDREVPASQVALMRASLAFSGSERLRFEFLDAADHDLLVAPATASLMGGAQQSADVARELHPRIPALIREFVARVPTTRPAPR